MEGTIAWIGWPFTWLLGVWLLAGAGALVALILDCQDEPERVGLRTPLPQCGSDHCRASTSIRYSENGSISGARIEDAA